MEKPKECIIVDGSCVKGGIIEYRGFHYPSMNQLFSKGPFDGGTNNIAEFLGLVSGMMYSEKYNLFLPVYSDSNTALSWVRWGKHNSGLEKTEENEQIFRGLASAEKWLSKNKSEVVVEKWRTDLWGENPADYDRK